MAVPGGLSVSQDGSFPTDPFGALAAVLTVRAPPGGEPVGAWARGTAGDGDGPCCRSSGGVVGCGGVAGCGGWGEF